MNNSPSCEFSRTDFDSDEDFLTFFTSRFDLGFVLDELFTMVIWHSVFCCRIPWWCGILFSAAEYRCEMAFCFLLQNTVVRWHYVFCCRIPLWNRILFYAAEYHCEIAFCFLLQNTTVKWHSVFCCRIPLWNGILFSAAEYRCEMAETIRSLTLHSPELTFTMASQWLQKELQKPVPGERITQLIMWMSRIIFFFKDKTNGDFKKEKKKKGGKW